MTSLHNLAKRGDDISVECWRLDAADKTAAFASFDSGVPALVHFGRQLPPDEKLEQLARLSMPNIAGGQLDPVVPLTLLPTAMDGWQGNPSVKLTDVRAPKLKLEAGARAQQTLAFQIEGDARLAIEVFLCPTTGLMKVSLTPIAGHFSWLAAAIPIPAHMPRIIDHGGRWCGEFQRQEQRFKVGRHVRESHEGRAGHAHFPGAIFASDGCGENSGECLFTTLSWSGGHRMVAEQVPDGRRQVQLGFTDGQSDTTREVWIGYSEAGFNGASRAMHAHVRATGVLASRKVHRPVHYNCWEAVYFRHEIEELKEIASIAADLGAERFILDDGWFNGRNDDTSSLGDWVVDPDKYPDGLHPLVNHIIGLGMAFGIWFEPEMVNMDSDLYRAHPDWVLGPENQPSGRGQFVLNLAKSAATKYLYDAIAAVLTEYPVTYVKWDHNRTLTGGGPEQVEALYGLLEKLTKAFPSVDFESCASGGGRVDYGMLRYATRVWLSDSNDALERLRMQHEASNWLPVEVQGSHVGPRHCHTSGRVLSMHFRAWVAAQRHMGFEMDPRELTDDESWTLKNVTRWYKEQRDFLHSAKYCRLDCDDPEVFAEMFVDETRDRFVTFIGHRGASAQIATDPVRLTGLDPTGSYEVAMVDTQSVPLVLNRNTAFGLASSRLSGAALMAGALRYPNLFSASMLVYEGKRVARSN